MTVKIDLVRLTRYLLKKIWIILLAGLVCGAAGTAYSVFFVKDSYTAVATMYVYNGNPNVVNYNYTNESDLDTAVQLVETYKIVVKSNKVLNAVRERLGLPLDIAYISKTLSMESVSDTGVMRIACTTEDPVLSADICNAVVDIAPGEIIRVVSAGSCEVIDYAEVPEQPNSHRTLRNAAIGFLAGICLTAGLFYVLFLFNKKLKDSSELVEMYELPLLSSIPDIGKKEKNTLLGKKTPSSLSSSYGRLRVNLLFAMRNKVKTILISSSVPGEGKSTVASNLAISFSLDRKRVLLIDADLRKPSKTELFQNAASKKGLSDMLIKERPQDVYDQFILKEVRTDLDVLPSGTIPPNPSELLNSSEMHDFVNAMEEKYDIVIIDLPPVNVVCDAFVLADENAGMLFVTRCGYSDHREIRKSLDALGFSDVTMLGTVMTCASEKSEGYYHRYYYKNYYSRYDRNQVEQKENK